MTMGKLFDKLLNRKKERHPRCAALVSAAGHSERMGGTDKLTAPLCGVPSLATWVGSAAPERRYARTSSGSITPVAAPASATRS